MQLFKGQRLWQTTDSRRHRDRTKRIAPTDKTKNDDDDDNTDDVDDDNNDVCVCPSVVRHSPSTHTHKRGKKSKLTG